MQSQKQTVFGENIGINRAAEVPMWRDPLFRRICVKMVPVRYHLNFPSIGIRDTSANFELPNPQLMRILKLYNNLARIYQQNLLSKLFCEFLFTTVARSELHAKVSTNTRNASNFTADLVPVSLTAGYLLTSDQSRDQ